VSGKPPFRPPVMAAFRFEMATRGFASLNMTKQLPWIDNTAKSLTSRQL
jgi:hypothetical protein